MLRLAAARMPRAMCAVANSERNLLDELKADIAHFKEALASPPEQKGYTLEQLNKVLDSGEPIDIAMLNDATENMDDDSKRAAVNIAKAITEIRTEMSKPKLEIDWAAEEAELGAETVAVVKKALEMAEAEVAQGGGFSDTAQARLKEIEELKGTIEDNFKGPKGIFTILANGEKEQSALFEQKIKEMEELLWKAEGIKDLTVAEILERDPELREKIEDEIRNNVWAP